MQSDDVICSELLMINKLKRFKVVYIVHQFLILLKSIVLSVIGSVVIIVNFTQLHCTVNVVAEK